jgi:REP element-mobilizing transposase RayT
VDDHQSDYIAKLKKKKRKRKRKRHIRRPGYFLHICDVAKLAIIHNTIKPNVSINNI